VASTGYLRGRTQITLVKGGAAPKMLAEDEHFHEEMFAPGNDTDPHSELDLSEIRAGVEATLHTVSAQVANLEAALGKTTLTGGRDTRAARAAEARLKGFEGDSCGACGNFTLVRNGTCMKCNTCGSTSGCS
jgi:ribonucleoside-diphosphate reductase alpha chain